MTRGWTNFCLLQYDFALSRRLPFPIIPTWSTASGEKRRKIFLWLRRPSPVLCVPWGKAAKGWGSDFHLCWRFLPPVWFFQLGCRDLLVQRGTTFPLTSGLPSPAATCPLREEENKWGVRLPSPVVPFPRLYLSPSISCCAISGSTCVQPNLLTSSK